VRRSLLSAILLAALAGCDEGAKKYGGATPSDDPVAVYGNCAFCHVDLATHMVDTGGHGSLDVPCTRCHDNVAPEEPGPGHATVPVCADCHGEQVTHFDPLAGTPEECLVCHTPHGSPNLLLIKTEIETPMDERVQIVFDNLRGLADGSFASVSNPGSGLCEVCHTDTMYYRNDGSGLPHFPFACYTCHPHADGFEPED
jgi:predicted CXXCH cytochrome family protein